MSTDPDQIVRDFCDAWGRADLETILDGFAPDATYHNIPMEPLVGIDAIRAGIEGMLKMSPKGVQFEILNQVVAGNVVFNERIDTFDNEGKEVAAPVAGVFELNDAGKISAWRDYFDMGAFQG